MRYIGQHRITRARSLALPAVGLTLGAALATATGKVAWVVKSLPFTDTPNGFTLLCLTVLIGGCFWRMNRAETTAHPSLELDELIDLGDLEQEPWLKPPRQLRAEPEPWFGARPLDLDPDEVHPTILPSPRSRRRVRS